MALIKCKECGKEISSEAKVCPNCGYENKKTTSNKQSSNQIKTGSIVSLIACSIIIILILGFIIMGLTGSDNNSNQSEDVIVSVQLTPSYVYLDDLTHFAISLFLTLICFIMIILFLTKKFKSIRLYKCLLLLMSIAQLMFAIMSISVLVCCGIIYAIFPLINVIGAIIVATGKAI